MEPNDRSICSLHPAWSQTTVRFAPRTLHGAKRLFDLPPALCMDPNDRSICSLRSAWTQTTVRLASRAEIGAKRMFRRTKNPKTASRNTKPSFVSARRAAFVTFVRPNHSRLPVVYEPSSDLKSVSPTISIAFIAYASGTAIGNICAPDADLSAFHPLFPSFTETEYLPAA